MSIYYYRLSLEGEKKANNYISDGLLKGHKYHVITLSRPLDTLEV